MVEDNADTKNSSDADDEDQTVSKVASSGLGECSGPVLAREISDSLNGVTSSGKEENNSVLELSTHDNHEIEEVAEATNVRMDKRSSLLTMNFSGEEVDLAINRLGESAPLPELIDFIVAAQTAPSFREKEINGSVGDEDWRNEETNAETSFGTMEKTHRLLDMGFSEDEISSAIDILGPEAPTWELADSIFASQISRRCLKEEDMLKEKSNISLQNQNESGCLGRATEGHSKRWHPVTEMLGTKPSSSSAIPYHVKGIERGKKAKRGRVNDRTASYSNHRQRAKLAGQETVYRAKPTLYNKLGNLAEARLRRVEMPNQPTPDICRNVHHSKLAGQETVYRAKPTLYNKLGNLAEARLHRVEMPNQPTPDVCRNVHHFQSKAPYFFYGNVVDVSQETCRKLSQYLYGIVPEYVYSQFFSAFNRKEGYFHNLPTKNRFRILPKPPMTIGDALPHIKKWWPSWDFRKHLSCISDETTGVDRLCKRLGKMMIYSQGMPSAEQKKDILHQCKILNLIWVDQYKLSPVKPDELECILGYPLQHTQVCGVETPDRLRALKYCFQTDTLGYHLSVLKDMYPDGLKVLSVYTGIGGAEVALDRLGIRLKCVVSVEASEVNQETLRRWWENTAQSGVLMQIESIEKLTIQKLEGFMELFGGFDIIIGGNPCRCASGNPNSDSSVGVDFVLFYEFVRLFQRMRSIMGRNG